jgi:hypothetical protein
LDEISIQKQALELKASQTKPITNL